MHGLVFLFLYLSYFLGVRTNLLTLQPALRTLTNDYNCLKRQVRDFPLLLQEALKSAKSEVSPAGEWLLLQIPGLNLLNHVWLPHLLSVLQFLHSSSSQSVIHENLKSGLLSRPPPPQKKSPFGNFNKCFRSVSKGCNNRYDHLPHRPGHSCTQSLPGPLVQLDIVQYLSQWSTVH